VIQHRILKEHGCIYIEVRKSPLLADFVSASSIMVRDPAYGRDLNRLCDLSQANLSHITIPQLVEYVDYVRKNIPMSSTARVAIVAPNSERAGLLRSFAQLIDRGSFRIFYDPMQARKWVEERPHFYRDDGSFCKVLGGVA
jgi:hypothetical protein